MCFSLIQLLSVELVWADPGGVLLLDECLTCSLSNGMDILPCRTFLILQEKIMFHFSYFSTLLINFYEKISNLP